MRQAILFITCLLIAAGASGQQLSGTLKKIKPFVEAVIIALTLVFAIAIFWQRAARRFRQRP